MAGSTTSRRPTCWAGAPRSTHRSTCGAGPRIMMSGMRCCAARTTIPAGAGRTFCRTSGAWKATNGCSMICIIRKVHCWSPTPVTSTIFRAGSCSRCRRWASRTTVISTGRASVALDQFMNRSGKRSSAAYAFIAPLQNDARLEVRLHARVQRIIIENSRAVGVTYLDANSQERAVFAEGEVILAAGALVTPQLLMLSGIGPAAQLREHGIKCLIDLPGVGKNLIDHPEVPIVSVANGRYGYYKQGEGWRMLRNGLQFKLFGTGPILSAGVEAGAFVNPTDRDAEPTIQAFCVPIIYLDRDTLDLLPKTYGLTITTVVIKPNSRGFVRVASANPADMPLVSPNLLSDPADARTMIEGQRFFLRAFQTSPLKERIREICIPDPANLSDEARS